MGACNTVVQSSDPDLKGNSEIIEFLTPAVRRRRTLLFKCGLEIREALNTQLQFGSLGNKEKHRASGVGLPLCQVGMCASIRGYRYF